MKKQTDNKRTEAILNSFDGIQPAELPPFFYTRLRARMQREQEESSLPAFFLRPAFLTISLSLILVLNVLFLVNTSGKSGASIVNTEKAGIESFANAYGLGSSSVYE